MSAHPSLALISLQNTYIDFGVRYVAASCRSAGIRTGVLWTLRDPDDPMSREEYTAIAEWIRDQEYALAGIGIMSLNLTRAVELTRIIREIAGVPVIWGGIHAILAPEECLEHADFVCVGEGESGVPDLAARLHTGLDALAADPPENIWFNVSGSPVRPARTVIPDLDAIPLPDYDLSHHVQLDRAAVIPLTVEIMLRGMPWNANRHYVISSRGCPFNCSYCSNSALRRIFGKQYSLRNRSVDSLLAEITLIRSLFPFVSIFAIMDDSFFFKPDGWLAGFCRGIKPLGIQFGVLVHPRTVNRDELEMLTDAGLIGVQMGLQSGSNRVLKEVFNRPDTAEEFIQATRILDTFMDRWIGRTYDVIVDNPFETEAETAETVRVLAACQKPFLIDIFSLTLFPGTDLYHRQTDLHGLLPHGLGAADKNYLNYRPTMLNRLVWLSHCNPAKLVLFFLENRQKAWVRPLFLLYFHGWENGLRILLRKIKHGLLSRAGVLAQRHASRRF